MRTFSLTILGERRTKNGNKITKKSAKNSDEVTVLSTRFIGNVVVFTLSQVNRKWLKKPPYLPCNFSPNTLSVMPEWTRWRFNSNNESPWETLPSSIVKALVIPVDFNARIAARLRLP